MARISQRTIERIKESARILDVLGDRPLKRMGREFVTECPWHDDRKPSLTVSPQKNFVWCPVCNRGTDALGWLQDQGLTFTEAIENLSHRYNISIEMEDVEDNEKLIAERRAKAELYSKREEQQAAFSEALFQDRDACVYLKDRGISKATAEAWGLGLTPGRLMIPLKDAQGRTVAFTGRALGDQMPKYKNSPNDLLFDKSRMVFGLNRAMAAIRKTREVVIGEGQFDVIKLHQEGIENVVAVSGTALTEQQIESLTRRCGARRVVLCLDGDKAGVAAAWRAIGKLQGLALSETIDLRVLQLGQDQDPDSYVREFGAAAMAQQIEEATHWVEWQVEQHLAGVNKDDIESLSKAEAGVRDLLRILPAGPRRAWVLRAVADSLGQAPKVKPAAPVVTKQQRDARAWAERRAVRCYLLLPQSREQLQGMTLELPPYAEAWKLIQFLRGCVASEAISAAFGRVIRSLPENDFHELRSLLCPVPEILSFILSSPDQEIADTLAGLENTSRNPAPVMELSS